MTRAAEAARRAGVELRTAEELADLEQIDALFTEVWGGEQQDAVSVNMMRALVHAGHYIGTAWRGRELVGAAAGFSYAPGGEASLHSHIAAVSPGGQSAGVGFALKLHQAEWCLGRGLTSITWTFDPLIRRNAWFNLSKLGARAERYLVNFYGAMQDELNDGEATDRCLVVWDLTVGLSHERPDRGSGRMLLDADENGRPVVASATAGAKVALCRIPDDVLALRRHEPDLARKWREAMRVTMGEAMATGFVATSFTSDGYYLLERTCDED